VIGNEWYPNWFSGTQGHYIKDELLGTSLALLCNSGIYFSGGT
jgi:hypothetical protein